MGCTIPRLEIDQGTLENWHLLTIKELCCIPEEFVSEEQYQPKLLLFQELISNKEFIIEDVHFLNKSKTFHKILKIKANKNKGVQNVGYTDVIQHILKPTKDTWCDLCIKIKDGSISIHETEKYCLYELSAEELYLELIAMNRGVNGHWIQERIDHLQRLKMCLNTVFVSSLLMEVKERYHVPGSFENLKFIANSVSIFS